MSCRAGRLGCNFNACVSRAGLLFEQMSTQYGFEDHLPARLKRFAC